MGANADERGGWDDRWRSVAGLVLAAGAGTRMGRPKALVGDARGPWLVRAVQTLLEAGCEAVVVVLGARADEAMDVLDLHGRVRVVLADDWADGQAASLRAGLRGVWGAGAGEMSWRPAVSGPDAVLVTLVDLPRLSVEACRRVLSAAADAGALGHALARATDRGRPGHPVLIGREHAAGGLASAHGDHGARDYLRAHDSDVLRTACDGLGCVDDRDTPEAA